MGRFPTKTWLVKSQDSMSWSRSSDHLWCRWQVMLHVCNKNSEHDNLTNDSVVAMHLQLATNLNFPVNLHVLPTRGGKRQRVIQDLFRLFYHGNSAFFKKCWQWWLGVTLQIAPKRWCGTIQPNHFNPISYEYLCDSYVKIRTNMDEGSCFWNTFPQNQKLLIIDKPKDPIPS